MSTHHFGIDIENLHTTVQVLALLLQIGTQWRSLACCQKAFSHFLVHVSASNTTFTDVQYVRSADQLYERRSCDNCHFRHLCTWTERIQGRCQVRTGRVNKQAIVVLVAWLANVAIQQCASTLYSYIFEVATWRAGTYYLPATSIVFSCRQRIVLQAAQGIVNASFCLLQLLW